MKVLLVGSGGREHSLAWRLANSEKCEALYCAPGNAGIEDVAECVDIPVMDIPALVSLAKEKEIDLVVVGPEDPLCAGLADALQTENILVFGPKENAAILEGSKAFMKDLCAKYNIPTAEYGRFTSFEAAKKFIDKLGAPIVVKTSGLAAGKGVIICETLEEAYEAAQDMLSGESFGDAGSEIVVEEFMVGEELSYFAIADGKTVLPLTSAQDHKRVGDGDTGLNTGGMGAYSPAHFVTPALEKKIMDTIIIPTVEGMKAEGRPFAGVLFAGLMMVGDTPKLIEFNARFGDPECQVLMTRLKGDLLELLTDAARGNLAKYSGALEWTDKVTLTIVMASNGYPGNYKKGTVIKGVQDAEHHEGVKVFHAGTARSEAGELVNVGGRVLNITAGGENIGHAQRLAYQAAAKIDWPGGFYRKDIGWRAVEAAKKKGAA